MLKKSYQNNYAFIDSQNLNLAILDAGWKLDFQRFFVHLKHKYRITKAYIFLGYIPSNKPLYKYLNKAGYSIIFKPTIKDHNGSVKGNVDAELVLHCMLEYTNFDKAVIISGDGDFHCLIDQLKKDNKLLKVGIPNQYKYSALLRDFKNFLFYINRLRTVLECKKRPIKVSLARKA